MFVAYDDDKMYTYVYYRDTVEGRCLLYDGCLYINFNFSGPSCVFAGNTKLPYGQKPLMLYNGEVSCLTLSGKVSWMCYISCTLIIC